MNSHHLSKYSFVICIDSLPNNKILDWSNLQAFADKDFNITKTMISVCDRVENTVGKGENAGYQFR